MDAKVGGALGGIDGVSTKKIAQKQTLRRSNFCRDARRLLYAKAPFQVVRQSCRRGATCAPKIGYSSGWDLSSCAQAAWHASVYWSDLRLSSACHRVLTPAQPQMALLFCCVPTQARPQRTGNRTDRGHHGCEEQAPPGLSQNRRTTGYRLRMRCCGSQYPRPRGWSRRFWRGIVNPSARPDCTL